MIVINEWCPHCETEVTKRLERVEPFHCPECGMVMLPCSMCNLDETNCEQCPYENE